MRPPYLQENRNPVVVSDRLRLGGLGLVIGVLLIGLLIAIGYQL